MRHEHVQLLRVSAPRKLLIINELYIVNIKLLLSLNRTFLFHCKKQSTKRKTIRVRIYLRKQQPPATAKNNSLIGIFLLNYFSSNRLLAFAVFLRQCFFLIIFSRRKTSPTLPCRLLFQVNSIAKSCRYLAAPLLL